MKEQTAPSPVLTEIPRYQASPVLSPLAEPLRTSPMRLLAVVGFALTFLTTTMAGAYFSGVDSALMSLSNLAKGLSYSVPLMAILLAHELGHFFVARRNAVESSWPYFFPAPFPSYLIFGTFGAFIRMKSPPRSRRVMFDIGAAGPWAGVILAIPAVIIGLKLSEVTPLDTSAGGLEFGNSLLFYALTRMVLGVDPNSVTINLHPVAIAGWLGLFVTALNLLPVGQLDGGHVIYALFGRRHRLISRLFVLSCVALVIVPYLMGWSFWLGWILWAVLLIMLGVGHPSTTDSETALDRNRRILAWLTVALFILTFSPVPLSFTPPTPHLPKGETFEVMWRLVARHRLGLLSL